MTRPFTFGSVCSGIEAASLAWGPLGWQCAFVAEHDPDSKARGLQPAQAVLKTRFPDVPNWGDITKFRDWPDATIDLLAGGTPCASFSIAGLRKGLADPRGDLMLVYGAVAQRYRPSWLFWENVPGVLSSNEGRDFGAFLGMLAELGYGFAYRVLDAQFVRVESHPRAVPQRRRRVFVVGYLGDWRPPAAVLFERESLRGDSPPRREARQGDARAIAARAEERADASDALIAFGGNDTRGAIDVATARNAHRSPHGRLDFGTETFVAHPIAYNITPSQGNIDYNARPTERAQALTSEGNRPTARGGDIVTEPIAFALRGREGGSLPEIEGDGDTAGTLRAATGGSSRDYVADVATEYAVRRLTPRECERLQGLPDDWTLVEHRRRPLADGPRYKLIGNSWAVPCVRWIGERIELVRAALPPCQALSDSAKSSGDAR
jgi:DNA (cytosine-5)-methyltransferase 1